MDGDPTPTVAIDRRRALVLGVTGGLALLAGCTTDEPTSTARTATEDGGPTAEELDLREANVVAVDVASVDGGYRFSVTLHHDDAGEDGYADWWQVETVDGERIGRRELLHAHGTEPFTRSTTVAVPGGVDCVVVRGHDQVHGYGGRAMVVDLASGETWSVSQGSARRAVTAEACPDR